MCNIKRGGVEGRLLQECVFVVWDECTMSNKSAFEALDRTLQDLRGNSRLMGGMTVLLSGDFRQTLPVVPRGTRADEIKACLKKSYLWPNAYVNLATQKK
uniref:ATP-dependent DNA helicase n=1 Tax=Cacopsylla melanoneura TaxID=428564 RepID=A0A8D8ZUH9_9HEMI